MPAGVAQQSQLDLVCAAAKPAGDKGGLDHGCGLVEMDEIEFGRGGIGFLLRKQVLHLAPDEVLASGRLREGGGEGGAELGPHCVVAWQQLEGVGEEGVAGEQGGGLVELLVRGGTTPAKVIVVHARQVVVHQRVSVDALERHSDRQGIVGGGPEGIGGRKYQHGAQTLAARLQAVAHRLVQPGRAGAGGGQVPVEPLFDPFAVSLELLREIHGERLYTMR